MMTSGITESAPISAPLATPSEETQENNKKSLLQKVLNPRLLFAVAGALTCAAAATYFAPALLAAPGYVAAQFMTWGLSNGFHGIGSFGDFISSQLWSSGPAIWSFITNHLTESLLAAGVGIYALSKSASHLLLWGTLGLVAGSAAIYALTLSPLALGALSSLT